MWSGYFFIFFFVFFFSLGFSYFPLPFFSHVTLLHECAIQCRWARHWIDAHARGFSVLLFCSPSPPPLPLLFLSCLYLLASVSLPYTHSCVTHFMHTLLSSTCLGPLLPYLSGWSCETRAPCVLTRPSGVPSGLTCWGVMNDREKSPTPSKNSQSNRDFHQIMEEKYTLRLVNVDFYDGRNPVITKNYNSWMFILCYIGCVIRTPFWNNCLYMPNELILYIYFRAKIIQFLLPKSGCLRCSILPVRILLQYPKKNFFLTQILFFWISYFLPLMLLLPHVIYVYNATPPIRQFGTAEALRKILAQWNQSTRLSGWESGAELLHIFSPLRIQLCRRNSHTCWFNYHLYFIINDATPPIGQIGTAEALRKIFAQWNQRTRLSRWESGAELLHILSPLHIILDLRYHPTCCASSRLHFIIYTATPPISQIDTAEALRKFLAQWNQSIRLDGWESGAELLHILSHWYIRSCPRHSPTCWFNSRHYFIKYNATPPIGQIGTAEALRKNFAQWNQSTRLSRWESGAELLHIPSPLHIILELKYHPTCCASSRLHFIIHNATPPIGQIDTAEALRKIFAQWNQSIRLDGWESGAELLHILLHLQTRPCPRHSPICWFNSRLHFIIYNATPPIGQIGTAAALRKISAQRNQSTRLSGWEPGAELLHILPHLQILLGIRHHPTCWFNSRLHFIIHHVTPSICQFETAAAQCRISVLLLQSVRFGGQRPGAVHLHILSLGAEFVYIFLLLILPLSYRNSFVSWLTSRLPFIISYAAIPVRHFSTAAVLRKIFTFLHPNVNFSGRQSCEKNNENIEPVHSSLIINTLLGYKILLSAYSINLLHHIHLFHYSSPDKLRLTFFFLNNLGRKYILFAYHLKTQSQPKKTMASKSPTAPCTCNKDCNLQERTKVRNAQQYALDNSIAPPRDIKNYCNKNCLRCKLPPTTRKKRCLEDEAEDETEESSSSDSVTSIEDEIDEEEEEEEVEESENDVVDSAPTRDIDDRTSDTAINPTAKDEEKGDAYVRPTPATNEERLVPVTVTATDTPPTTWNQQLLACIRCRRSFVSAAEGRPCPAGCPTLQCFECVTSTGLCTPQCRTPDLVHCTQHEKLGRPCISCQAGICDLCPTLTFPTFHISFCSYECYDTHTSQLNKRFDKSQIQKQIQTAGPLVASKTQTLKAMRLRAAQYTTVDSKSDVPLEVFPDSDSFRVRISTQTDGNPDTRRRAHKKYMKKLSKKGHAMGVPNSVIPIKNNPSTSIWSITTASVAVIRLLKSLHTMGQAIIKFPNTKSTSALQLYARPTNDPSAEELQSLKKCIDRTGDAKSLLFMVSALEKSLIITCFDRTTYLELLSWSGIPYPLPTRGTGFMLPSCSILPTYNQPVVLEYDAKASSILKPFGLYFGSFERRHHMIGLQLMRLEQFNTILDIVRSIPGLTFQGQLVQAFGLYKFTGLLAITVSPAVWASTLQRGGISLPLTSTWIPVAPSLKRQQKSSAENATNHTA